MKMINLIFLLAVFLNVSGPILSDNHFELSESYRVETVEYKKGLEFQRFLNDLGEAESSGDYRRWNRFGYVGKYQFGFSARKSTGFEHIKFRDFIRDPNIWLPEEQEQAMLIYTYKNQMHLQSIIDQIESGELIVYAYGKPVTKSGIIAGAHLGGIRGVKLYVKYSRNPCDAFGTSIANYMHRFSGYEF